MTERLFDEKMEMLESLTGVNSSKLNYYLEAKKRNEEIIKQNNRLEIIYQIIQDINIDMSLEDVINRVYQKLPQAIYCNFLGLSLLRRNDLYLTAIVPRCTCAWKSVPDESVIWEVVHFKESKIYDFRNLDANEFLNCSSVENLDLCSLALAPLVVKGNVIGVLMVGSKYEKAYSTDEIKFINQLAGQLAICIENARLYEQVYRGKKEWEETFKAVTDPIFLIDLNYKILRCNGRLEGLPENAGEVKEKRCYKILWGREKKCDYCLLDEVCSTGDSAYRRFQLPDGKVYDVFYYPVYNEKNKIYAIIHHIKDVTEQVKIEAQLMQSAKLAAIGEMAAGVAHELNSPMTAILGNAQMLLRDMNEDDLSIEYVNDIVNCGLRCKKIIQNLLTFSRQDERPVSYISLSDVVERVLSLIKYQINRNNVKVEIDLDPEIPEVQANAHQLDQVLVNLLLNARDAMENNRGYKEIRVETGKGEFEDKNCVYMSVKDNGEGISPERIGNIFNPFYTSKGVNQGTGLGLSVSLGIAEAHGGTIYVESNPGQGSKFTIVLPLEE